MPTQQADQQTLKQGIIYALAAYGMWGLFPVYFKAVEHISPFEVVAHRVIWSMVFLGLFIIATERWQTLLETLKQSAIVKGLVISSLFVSGNWLVFIWAVGDDRILETSLGYFINPLVSMMLGMIFLGERMRPGQWLAIALAGMGVLYQLIQLGTLPWVAFVLAGSFGTYGLLRKKITVDPFSGLMIETLLLTPLALGYLLWLGWDGTLIFGQTGSSEALLLMAAGVVTSLPLISFAAGTKRLTLTLNGLLQYTAPSITFLLAIWVYNEPMDINRLITFIFIWAGLVLFTVEGITRSRQLKKMQPAGQ